MKIYKIGDNFSQGQLSFCARLSYGTTTYYWFQIKVRKDMEVLPSNRKWSSASVNFFALHRVDSSREAETLSVLQPSTLERAGKNS